MSDEVYQPPPIRHDDEGAPPPLPPGGGGSGGGDPPPYQPAGSGDSPDEELVVDSRTAIEECLHAHRTRRRIIAVVGLPTTGKSFFIKRLMNVLDYDTETPWGTANNSDQEIARTKGVLLYKFTARDSGNWFQPNSRRSPRNFDIYDVPGDFFAAMVRDNFTVEDDPEVARVIYALCAFADAFIFVAPALQVLKPDVFQEEGDGILNSYADRKQRVTDTGRFIASLNPMSRTIAVLRDRIEHNVRAARRKPKKVEEARALANAQRNDISRQKLKPGDFLRRDAAIQAIEDILPMKTRDFQKVETSVSRLAQPALLLLSRGDEFQAKMSRSRDTFDADPCLPLAALNENLLSGMSGWFATLAVDFMTAQDGHVPGAEFKERGVSFGVRGLMEDWLLPAINHARRPRFVRALQSARTALWVRRLIDPDFARVWTR